MGAAYEYMRESESRQSLITKKNKQIRELKKTVNELAQGIVDNFDGYSADSADFILQEMAEKVLAKQNKKKKK